MSIRKRRGLTVAAAALLLLPAASPIRAGEPADSPAVRSAGEVAAKDAEGVELPSRGKSPKPESPAASPAAGRKDEPSFEDLVKESRKIEGLFNLYEKDGRYLMEIKPDQLDKEFMLSVTRETGVGELGLLAVQVLGEVPVRFHRVGKRVQMILVNTRFAAQDDPEMRRAVEKSFSDSLQGATKVESQPHPDTKAVLVDISPFFFSDIEGIGVFLAQRFQTPYGLDRENSTFLDAKGFPMNLELEAQLHFTGARPAAFVNLPDSRSLFVSYRYSLSQVPAAPDFLPRIADDRVGHFLALYQDFSDDRRDSPYTRYVTRWNLQKEEPYAAMSKPKEPITFWLENSIPKKYRKAVADGILMWNSAFEKIGFKDAIVVKQQPDDATWDPADVRYATVRWFVATDTAFAIGPSRINPRTGQIYDADIGWSESLVSGIRREFEEMSDPVRAMNALFSEPEAMRPVGLLGARSDPRASCELARGALDQINFGMSLLEARGISPDSPEADAYVNGFITYVQAHETGHTLGLRHNFRASVLQPNGDLQDASKTGAQGLVGSVMDYVPVNLAAAGQRQGQYWATKLGPYDDWAIEYAYKVFPGVKKPEDELPELRRIASRVAAAGNSYGTDEDTSDPTTNVWDLGSDPVAYYAQRTDLVRELWREIPGRLAREGDGYQVMRRAFGRGLGQFGLAVINVTKTIGGVDTFRDHVGDPQGRLPFQPVSAKTQRAALDFLVKNVFASDAFGASPDLLNRLAASRWLDFQGSIFALPRMEFPLHDVVAALQSNTLRLLYSPVKLDRLVDLEMQFPAGQQPFTLAEMFDGMKESIWSELYGSKGASAPRIDSFRRALQREHIRRLVDLVVRPAAGTPEDASTMARANLADLKGKMDGALKAATLDSATRAHMEESRSIIEAALSAQILRMAGQG